MSAQHSADPVAHLGRLIAQYGSARPMRIAMAWAYFDETIINAKVVGTDKAVPTQMLVGGCIASEAKWRKLSADWKRELKKAKVNIFHAKDFYQFRRDFEWYDDKGERDWERHSVFRDRLADIIAQHVDEAVAFTSEVSLKNGKIRQAYTDGALRALHDCTKALTRGDDSIYVIFARHPEVSPWSIIRHFERLDWEKRLSGCGVFEPRDVMGLQAADFVLHSVNKSWGGAQTKSELRLAEGLRKRSKQFTVQLASTWNPPKDVLA